ncbi:DUF2267 domain-containing protein [Solwaraspora sp. WMMD406]|uniref:DUF2267 domain-containing protein n=1 Tax=Solwaraspora sp. WMMD406 TaxID=3016095 RepID=UPI0024178868|nr:DUF2267 domain-containing protein [Solwaraspora sp. WMMD406]MDG4763423.1 DUF2267 domain-containing protein [Solwaraspora sp. WMMD406]
MTTVWLQRQATTWQLDVAVLRTVVEHLPAGEAALLVDALPPLLTMAVRPDPDATRDRTINPDPDATTDTSTSSTLGATRLIHEVRRRTGLHELDAETVRRDVVATLERITGLVPAGVLYRVQLPLGDDVRELFPQPVRLRAVGTG